MNIFLSVIVSIMSFGAVPGDTTVNNAVDINNVIDHCARQGGGTVTVPQGLFSTGTIYLKSHVRLQFEDGAVLKGTSRLEDYVPLTTTLDLSKYESGRGTVNYNSATDPEWSKATKEKLTQDVQPR